MEPGFHFRSDGVVRGGGRLSKSCARQCVCVCAYVCVCVCSMVKDGVQSADLMSCPAMVQGILQLRPGFDHIDAMDRKQQEKEKPRGPYGRGCECACRGRCASMYV